MTKSNHFKPTLFLDRDGVLNEDAGYTHKIEDLVILDSVPQTLAHFKKLGFLLIVITNQSGVARGMYGLDDVNRFNKALDDAIFLAAGVRIDGFYVSPYHLDGTVPEFSIAHPDRKPGIGLIEKARKDFDIDMDRSFFIGDRGSDIGCAKNAKIPGIQVLSKESKPLSDSLAVVNKLEDIISVIKAHK
jgi:D-glycero-D-manno-heptose 1,7-bisphosphate phosphatase